MIMTVTTVSHLADSAYSSKSMISQLHKYTEYITYRELNKSSNDSSVTLVQSNP